MRALVIDDEQLVLEGLEALLQAMMPELSLDKTADVGTALQLASTVHYEVILLDWHLVAPDGQPIDGRELVQALRNQGSTAPMVVVSGDDRPEWPQILLELGLSGLVPKCATGTTLVDAIHVATRGGIYLPAKTRIQRVQPSYRQAPAPRPVGLRERYPELTVRQADVFNVMIRGLSDKQIARELGISEATVKTHVRGILGVVGVRRRGEAVFEITGGKPGG
jgi:two-component system nitrate/nitrite response regulator NarL